MRVLSNIAKRRLISILCLVVITFSSSIVMYTQAIRYIKITNSRTMLLIKEEKFDQIYSIINELTKRSKLQSKKVANNIEEDINKKINLDELKAELDNKNTSGPASKQLIDILQSNIIGKYLDIKNDNNGMLIMSNYGILEDLNYSRSSNKNFRSWKFEIERSYNQKLDEKAYNTISNHKKEFLIVTESTNKISNKNHTKINEATYTSLKDIYIKEGLEGLKNYQFLVPSYITNTGDIFGQKDIENGIKIPNHKIIVIQEFNIYDQIKNNINYSSSLSDDEDIMDILNENVLTVLYVLGITLVIGIIAIMFFMGMLYNLYIDYINKLDIYDDNEKDDETT